MQTGKLRWRFAASALAGVALIVGAWLVFGYNRQPRYEGQPVSYWFRQYYLRYAGPGQDTRHSRREITNALEHLGKQALPYLVGQALNPRQDTALRTNFYELLDKLPDSWHLPKLIDYDDIRDCAVGLIEEIEPKAEDLLPLLRDAANSTNTLLHYRALLIIRDMNHGEDQLVPICARALHYSDDDSRVMALSYLAGRGHLTNAVVPDLLESLKEYTNSDDFYQLAASVLGGVGPGAAAAVPRLRELFEHETNWSIRATLAGSLYQIDTNQTAALAFLTNGLQQQGNPEEVTGPSPVNPSGYYPGHPDDSSYASVAADELANIGTNARPAIPALLEALKSAKSSDLSQIADALTAVGAPADAFLPILREKLKSEDDGDAFLCRARNFGCR